MRVVLDTNVFVSALLVQSSVPAQLMAHWRKGRFTPLTAASQLKELTWGTRYPKIRARLKAAFSGRLINDLRAVAAMVEMLPPVDVSSDRYDKYLLSIASGGTADYSVTGDKANLLALGQYAGTRIVSVREFVTIARIPPGDTKTGPWSSFCHLPVAAVGGAA